MPSILEDIYSMFSKSELLFTWQEVRLHWDVTELRVTKERQTPIYLRTWSCCLLQIIFKWPQIKSLIYFHSFYPFSVSISLFLSTYSFPCMSLCPFIPISPIFSFAPFFSISYPFSFPQASCSVNTELQSHKLNVPVLCWLFTEMLVLGKCRHWR